MEIIQEIGSYAGLAAILGLAVLSALYFSQARDVRRLRDWAGRAPERTSEPAAQPMRVGPRPVPRPPGTQPTHPGLRPPGQAASPGAAAAASTAGAAPAVATGPAAATPAAARAASSGEGAQAAAEGVSQDTMSHPAPSPLETDPDDQEAAVEEPERGATEDSPGMVDDLEPEEHEDDLAHEGHDEGWDDDFGEETGDRPAVSPPVPGAGAPARPVPPPPRITTLPPRTPPVTRANPALRASPVILPPYERSRPGGGPWYRRLFYSPGRAALAIGLGVLVLAGATLGGLRLAAGEEEPDAPAADQVTGAASATGAGGADGAPSAIDRSQTTVAVLNGTTVTGLAADVGDTVEREGYQLGNVTNSLDQQRAESVVFYAPGAEAEAEQVGRRLKIGQREEIDPETQALAGDASVVVVVGADKT